MTHTYATSLIVLSLLILGALSEDAPQSKENSKAQPAPDIQRGTKPSSARTEPEKPEAEKPSDNDASPQSIESSEENAADSKRADLATAVKVDADPKLGRIQSALRELVMAIHDAEHDEAFGDNSAPEESGDANAVEATKRDLSDDLTEIAKFKKSANRMRYGKRANKFRYG